MNQDYVDTVRLLLAVAPAVFRPPRFALKGGTALNLFVQDMPRLSIDIDVVFTDHTLDRETALKAIAADLKSVKSAILAMGYRAAARLHRARHLHDRYHPTRPRCCRTVWRKLVAAMDRQHPRDMFDVLKMIERFGSRPLL